MREFFKNFWTKERVFKNYVTSVGAILIVGYMLFLLTADKLSVEEGIALGGWALTLFQSKDTIIGKKEKNESKNEPV